MKKVITFISAMLLIMSCGPSLEETAIASLPNISSVNSVEDVVQTYKKLYNIYMANKQQDFAIEGSDYFTAIMAKADSLDETKYGKELKEKYRHTVDSSDFYSLMVNKSEFEESEFKESINSPLEKKEVDHNLIGRWMIMNTITTESGFVLTIKKDGNSYYSTENTTRYELKKKGNKYYKVGDAHGEYYIVNGKDVRLCDSNGDFTDESGYRVRDISNI